MMEQDRPKPRDEGEKMGRRDFFKNLGRRALNPLPSSPEEILRASTAGLEDALRKAAEWEEKLKKELPLFPTEKPSEEKPPEKKPEE